MQHYQRLDIELCHRRLSAIVADTYAKRMLGLMHRDSLKEGECMLFVFPNDGYHGIWMYNMRFPIDIIWIDSEMRVVEVFDDAKPCRSFAGCKSHFPKKAARYVLETESGFAERVGLKESSRLYVKAKKERKRK